ncbi:unnamed protein product [Ceratitis capitata]|uniref:(Mediterranean fruit fly) hypothetical protein n=1 Tax=Ceratitis capitata TaxID=7213 RepID=A0A811USY3_CERCA|nr:unnamed protein product [Ceratitis capitata]
MRRRRIFRLPVEVQKWNFVGSVDVVECTPRIAAQRPHQYRGVGSTIVLKNNSGTKPDSRLDPGQGKHGRREYSSNRSNEEFRERRGGEEIGKRKYESTQQRWQQQMTNSDENQPTKRRGELVISEEDGEVRDRGLIDYTKSINMRSRIYNKTISTIHEPHQQPAKLRICGAGEGDADAISLTASGGILEVGDMADNTTTLPAN